MLKLIIAQEMALADFHTRQAEKYGKRLEEWKRQQQTPKNKD